MRLLAAGIRCLRFLFVQFPHCLCESVTLVFYFRVLDIQLPNDLEEVVDVYFHR